MQLEPNVYLVGSGRFGFDLTHAGDCNIYLFDSGAGYVMFDAFFGGKVVWQHIYDCSVSETNASIQRLATYDFDALLPGHLNFSLRDGKRHILAACAIIERLGCPQSIG